jgi:hypothetical protein
VRDPKVRLRGLGEIATNAPHAFLLQCTYLQLALSGHDYPIFWHKADIATVLNHVRFWG